MSNLSVYSPLTVSFSDTACFAWFNFSLTPSKFSDNTANPFKTLASFPKISEIINALSALFEFLIFSRTFKIVPSASIAISLCIVSGFNPNASKAAAFLFVSAPWANSA